MDYKPKIVGKTKAGVIVVATPELVQVEPNSAGGCDNYRILESGLLQRTSQGASIQMTSGGDQVSDNSAVIAQPGDTVTFDYRTTDDETGSAKEVQPPQSITVPTDSTGGQTPPTPAAPPMTGHQELDLANSALYIGGKLVNAPGGSAQIVDADGTVVVNRATFDKAHDQASAMSPDDPSARYLIDAILATMKDSTVIGGNPGAVAGSEG